MKQKSCVRWFCRGAGSLPPPPPFPYAVISLIRKGKHCIVCISYNSWFNIPFVLGGNSTGQVLDRLGEDPLDMWGDGSVGACRFYLARQPSPPVNSFKTNMCNILVTIKLMYRCDAVYHIYLIKRVTSLDSRRTGIGNEITCAVSPALTRMDDPCIALITRNWPMFKCFIEVCSLLNVSANW